MSSNQNNPPQITNQPEKPKSENINKEKLEIPQFDPEKFKSAENCNHCKNCKCPCHFRERGERGRGMFRGRGMPHGRGMFRGFPMFPPWMMGRGFGRGHLPSPHEGHPPHEFEGERERGRGMRGRGFHHWGHHWGPYWGGHFGHPWGGNWGEEHRPRGHSSDHFDENMGYENYGYDDYDMYGYESSNNKGNDKKNLKK